MVTAGVRYTLLTPAIIADTTTPFLSLEKNCHVDYADIAEGKTPVSNDRLSFANLNWESVVSESLERPIVQEVIPVEGYHEVIKSKLFTSSFAGEKDYTKAADTYSEIVNSIVNKASQRREVSYDINPVNERIFPKQNAQIFIINGESLNALNAYDFPASEHSVFIWGTPWKSQAPITGSIPAGVNVRDFLAQILPLLIESANSLLSLPFTTDLRSRVLEGENSIKSRIAAQYIGWGKVFEAADCRVDQFEFKSSFKFEKKIQSVSHVQDAVIYQLKKESISTTAISQDIVSLNTLQTAANMLAVSTVIELMCKRTTYGNRIVFSGMLLSNAVASAVEQMYAEMVASDLPKKPKIEFVRSMMNYNILGVGGIGSIFAEIKNFVFPCVSAIMQIGLEESRRTYRFSILDMDTIELHNLNRSSIFNRGHAITKAKKVNVVERELENKSGRMVSLFPINKVFSKHLDAPYTQQSREALGELFGSTLRGMKTLSSQGAVIDCRDVISSSITIDKTNMKLSYDGDNRLGFHFNLDKFVNTLFVLPGSNYAVIPSFVVPPKISVALCTVFLGIPFFDKHAKEYAEFNIANLMMQSSSEIA